MIMQRYAAHAAVLTLSDHLKYERLCDGHDRPQLVCYIVYVMDHIDYHNYLGAGAGES